MLHPILWHRSIKWWVTTTQAHTVARLLQRTTYDPYRQHASTAWRAQIHVAIAFATLHRFTGLNNFAKKSANRLAFKNALNRWQKCCRFRTFHQSSIQLSLYGNKRTARFLEPVSFEMALGSEGSGVGSWHQVSLNYPFLLSPTLFHHCAVFHIC